MKLKTPAVIAACTLACHIGTAAADQLNAKQYIQQRGWEPYDAAHTAKSPTPDLVPVLYYESDESVPSCGIISSMPGSKEPRFTKLMQAPKGEEFPQCVNVVAIVPFRLESKDYLSVEYLVRDTREDLYRRFAYLYKDPKQGYVPDEKTTKPATLKAKDISAATANATRLQDGPRLARIAYLKQAYAQWQFHDRDFISDKGSSFALFDDGKSGNCLLVTEAGNAPTVAKQSDFLAGAQCTAVLASSRLEKPGTTYYLALLRLSNGTQITGITSVSTDGAVRVEKTLAERVNQAGASKDVKSAKAALANAIH